MGVPRHRRPPQAPPTCWSATPPRRGSWKQKQKGTIQGVKPVNKHRIKKEATLVRTLFISAGHGRSDPREALPTAIKGHSATWPASASLLFTERSLFLFSEGTFYLVRIFYNHKVWCRAQRNGSVAPQTTQYD